MQVHENFSLQPYNTFKIQAWCNYFIQVNLIEELSKAIAFAKQQQLPFLILGGGSNVLFSQHYKGVIIQNNIKGIEYNIENDDILVTANAGENWHAFVQYCLQNNWYGLENLSLIPGNVGAAPIQNIGAYGVEVKDTIEAVICWHIEEEKIISFSNASCLFGYRNSIFKSDLKEEVVIIKVVFKLSTLPKVNTSYGAIAKVLQAKGIAHPLPTDVANAVIQIRESKLPNPTEIGNAGSFFKNPIVSKFRVHVLLEQYADMPLYAGNEADNFKLSAAWLIEQCGFKGYRNGDAGCYNLQPLVLVNYGQASGEEIYNLSTTIIQAVALKFAVVLEREVNII